MTFTFTWGDRARSFVLRSDGAAFPASIENPDYRALIEGSIKIAAPDLLAALREKLAELNAACAAHIEAGFTSDALGPMHHYPSKLTDQQNLSANVLSSLLPGNGKTWTTPHICRNEAGEWAYRPHTAAQIQCVGVDGKAAILAALTRKAELQAAAEAAAARDDEQGLAAIVWS